MGRIEDALKKLQSSSRPPAARPEQGTVRQRGVAPSPKISVPMNKVTVDGPRHHVPEDGLVDTGLLAAQESAVQVADEFRRIKRPLVDNAFGIESESSDHMNVIMIASALGGAGKTFCAVNLAVSLSRERSLNVVLVDADVVKPHISRAFGLEAARGLNDLLLGDVADIGETLVRTDLHDIQVLPAGRRHPQATELLASERMTSVVRDLALRYPDRIVVVDSPPLLATSEAQALASQVGQIVLIVEAGNTSQEFLVQSIDLLDSTKAINLLLNKTHRSQHVGYYGGGDYAYAPS